MAEALIALLFVSLTQRLVFSLACLFERRPPDLQAELPTVQVLVAAHDEEAMLPRFLESLNRLDYDPGKLSFVFVSDGSSDATPSLLDAWCRRRGDAVAIQLPQRSGKAAALQAAWNHARGAELTALYDADVQPSPQALRVLAREFADSSVGAATGAVIPSNPDVSMISRYAALELYVFHLVNQAARDRLGMNPHAVGAQSVYRTTALAALGGFPQREALSEDVETSFAIMKNGWRTRFQRNAVVTTDVPSRLADFWLQRERWTCGLYQAMWRAPGLAGIAAAMGYIDRFLFLGLVVAAVLGDASWFWPLVYFVGPALNIVLAVHRASLAFHRAGGRSKILVMVNALPMFAVDLGVTIFGTLMSLKPSSPSARVRWKRIG